MRPEETLLKPVQTTVIPNIKISFGDDGFRVQWHTKNPPNRLQRWLTWKMLGIKVEMI